MIVYLKHTFQIQLLIKFCRLWVKFIIFINLFLIMIFVTYFYLFFPLIRLYKYYSMIFGLKNLHHPIFSPFVDSKICTVDN